jgi:hypothetical protein
MAKKRTYLFKLPYETSWIERMGAQGRLESMGVWDRIPDDIKQAVNDGAPITAAMLDRIPTPVWTPIAAELGLEWK